ncbi:MAG: DUF3617 family protein [Novosphingobium sp.]
MTLGLGAAVGIGAAGVPPVLADGGSLALLSRLEPGRWELRTRGPSSSSERICLQSGNALVQVRHPDLPCERVVVEDTPGDVTVQYTCRGRGYGRTHIRRETNRLIQIETQGIAGGLPFDFAAEGRRLGDC